MERYTVSEFDSETFLVPDNQEQREICVCSNYDSWGDAQQRCEEIAALLNIHKNEHL